MIEDKIRELAARNYGKGAIARLLDVSQADVDAVIMDTIAEAEEAKTVDPADYSPEALERVASEALYILACQVHATPLGFKPNEALAIIREALDRTKGRAAQSVTIDTRSTVTYEHIMSIPPDEAYRRLMANVIDVTPGGGTAEQAAGSVLVCSPLSDHTQF